MSDRTAFTWADDLPTLVARIQDSFWHFYDPECYDLSSVAYSAYIQPNGDGIVYKLVDCEPRKLYTWRLKRKS